jgi:tetratricopeptide (TPR) repeat protein
MAPGAFMGIHFDRGQALFALQRYQEAVVEYQAELAQEPGCVYSKANIASCLINLGKFSDARAAVQDTLSQAPEYGFAYYLLSFLESKGGVESPALRAINEAVRLEPTVVRNVARLGWLLREQGRHSECLETTQRALALDPRHVDTLVLRAKTLEALGQPADAAATLRAALAIDPEDPDAHLALGNVALACGDPGEALNALREARRISPVKHHHRDKILEALARRASPFRKVYSLRKAFVNFGPITRWAIVASICTALLCVHAVVKPNSLAPDPVLTILYIVLANVLLFVLLTPFYAMLVVRVVARRELDYRWNDVVGDNCQAIVQLGLAHFVTSVLAMVMSFAIGVAYWFVGIAQVVDAFAMIIERCPNQNDARRWAGTALLIAGIAIAGIGGIEFGEYHWGMASALWVSLLLLSGFAAIVRQRVAHRPRG